MELLIVIGALGIGAGCIAGMLLASTHIDFEVERAYLTGHVDGYRKAMDDSGEVNA